MKLKIYPRDMESDSSIFIFGSNTNKYIWSLF